MCFSTADSSSKADLVLEKNLTELRPAVPDGAEQGGPLSIFGITPVRIGLGADVSQDQIGLGFLPVDPSEALRRADDGGCCRTLG